MLICHDWKLIFLHVPKCAGTSIRRLLEAEAPLGSVVSFFDFSYNHILRRHVDMAHLPLMDLRHYSEWSLLEEYHTVAVLRHPYSRLASACKEFYRQKSRETEVQMRTGSPTVEQLLDFLRALPSALDAHDLRYVHAFPIVWFTHYGARPMVDTLLSCDTLSEDLQSLFALNILPDNVLLKLLEQVNLFSRQHEKRPEESENDQNLRAVANVLHQEDFNAFGFSRSDARFSDPLLQEVIETSLSTTHSHSIPCMGLAPRVRWYWGRDSNRILPKMDKLRVRCCDG